MAADPTLAFQPVVELITRQPVGYEAIDAARDRGAGIRGLEAEAVAIAHAVEVARALPPHRWLGVNVSPALLVHPTFLADAVARAGRSIVFEMSEHAPVADFAALVAARRRLPPGTRIAIDDAGTGRGSLHDLLTVRPDFLKLDPRWVSAFDRDAASRALAAGLGYFATHTGCRLVANGIENESDVGTLTALGIRLGQGPLFGAPAPVAAWHA